MNSVESVYYNGLSSLGLSNDEIVVYEYLLSVGRSTVGNLKKNLQGISRPLIYLILEKLEQKRLVEKQELSGKVAVFIAKHPLTLTELLNKKEEEVNNAKVSLNSFLPKLTSMYNIHNGVPGVEYFEGDRAIREILADSLTSSETICQYLDVDAQEKFFHTENLNYQSDKKKSKILKKIIAIDTENTRKVFLEDAKNGFDIENVRLIKSSDRQLGVSLMIYDNKISYLSFNNIDKVVGMIIYNKDICNLQKFLFEVSFESGSKINQ